MRSAATQLLHSTQPNACPDLPWVPPTHPGDRAMPINVTSTLPAAVTKNLGLTLIPLSPLHLTSNL